MTISACSPNTADGAAQLGVRHDLQQTPAPDPVPMPREVPLGQTAYMQISGPQ